MPFCSLWLSTGLWAWKHEIYSVFFKDINVVMIASLQLFWPFWKGIFQLSLNHFMIGLELEDNKWSSKQMALAYNTFPLLEQSQDIWPFSWDVFSEIFQVTQTFTMMLLILDIFLQIHISNKHLNCVILHFIVYQQNHVSLTLQGTLVFSLLFVLFGVLLLLYHSSHSPSTASL